MNNCQIQTTSDRALALIDQSGHARQLCLDIAEPRPDTNGAPRIVVAHHGWGIAGPSETELAVQSHGDGIRWAVGTGRAVPGAIRDPDPGTAAFG